MPTQRTDIDFIDFEQDVTWYLRKIKSFFRNMAIYFILPVLYNQLVDFCNQRETITIFGSEYSLPQIGVKVIFPYLEIVTVSILIALGRYFIYYVMKNVKSLETQKKVVDFNFYYTEFLLFLIFRFLGGIECLVVFYFVQRIGYVSTMVSNRTLMKHVTFISVLVSMNAFLEYYGIITHYDFFSPPIGLYQNPVFVVTTVATFVLMLYMSGQSTGNAIRKSIEKEKLKGTLYKYLSPAVANEVIEHGSIILGGEKRVVTTLFADIRDFTNYSDKTSPEKVVQHLNEFFSEIVTIVFKHEGTLDKFMGDAVMATYGVLKAHVDDPYRAVKAAIEIRDAVKVLNSSWETKFQHQFKVGIGICTGEAIAGNIGSEQRMEYTVIGDSVNTAARLEELTKSYDTDIIISDTTYDAVKDKVEAKPLDKVTLKGKTEPIQVYGLLRILEQI